MPKLAEIRKALAQEANTPAALLALALFLGTLAIWAATFAECVAR